MAQKNIIQILINAKNASKAELNSASKDLTAFGNTAKDVSKKMVVAGAAITGALALIAKQSASVGDNLAKTSKRTGIAVSTLSKLGFAAEQSGSDLSSMQLSLKRLAASANDTKDGLLESKRAFDQVGVSVTDADGKLRPVEDLLLEISDKFKVMTNATEKAALAQKLLGRSGVQLIPLLNEGSDGIRALSEEAERLGFVWSDIDAKAAEDFVDAQNRVKRAVGGVRDKIALALFPAMTKYADKLSELIPKIGEFIKAHEGMVTALGATGVALIGGAGLVFGLGQAALGINQMILLAPKLATAMRLAGAAMGIALGPVLLAIAAAAAALTAFEIQERKIREREKSGELKAVGSAPVAPESLSGSAIGLEFIKAKMQKERDAINAAPGRVVIPGEPAFPDTHVAIPDISPFQRDSNGTLRDAIILEKERRDALAGSIALLESQRGLFDEVFGAPDKPGGASNPFQPLVEGADLAAQASVQVGSAASNAFGSLALSVLNGQNAIQSFGQAFSSIFTGLIAQLGKAVLLFGVFKGLSLIPGLGSLGGIGFGKLLGFASGGIVPAVPGSIPGRDSVLAALTPGELVIPQTDINAILGGGGIPSPRVVNINGPILGTTGMARELAREITNLQNLNDTGEEL